MMLRLLAGRTVARAPPRWRAPVLALRGLGTTTETPQAAAPSDGDRLFDYNMQLLEAANLVAKTEATSRVRDLALKMQAEGIRPDINTFNALVFAYTRSGLMHHAVEMYEQMRALGIRPTIATYNLLLKVSSTRGDVWRCFTLVQELLDEGIEPTIETYQHLLVACQISGDAYASMRVLEDLLSSGSTDVPLGMYDRVLSQLVENQLVDQVIDTYRSLKEASRLHPIALMRILHALLNTDHTDLVNEIAHRLLVPEIRVPQGLLLDMFYYAVRYGNVSVAERSLKALRQLQQGELPIYHYGALALAYATNSQWLMVFRFFRAVEPLVQHDESAVIEGVTERMARSKRDVQNAFDALVQMHKEQEEIPQMAFHAVLSACGFKLIDPNLTFDMFAECLKLGMQHSATAYEPLLYICFKYNLRDQAAKQLSAMSELGITPSHSCYMSLVKMAINSGELTTAMHYLGQSLRHHSDVTLSRKTIYSLVNLCLTKDPTKLPVVIEFADQLGAGTFARATAQKMAVQASQPPRQHVRRRRVRTDEDEYDETLHSIIAESDKHDDNM